MKYLVFLLLLSSCISTDFSATAHNPQQQSGVPKDFTLALEHEITDGARILYEGTYVYEDGELISAKGSRYRIGPLETTSCTSEMIGGNWQPDCKIEEVLPTLQTVGEVSEALPAMKEKGWLDSCRDVICYELVMRQN